MGNNFRRISPKRARVLRKRNENVFWDAGITKFVFYFSAEPSESAIEIINDFQQDFDIVFVNFKP